MIVIFHPEIYQIQLSTILDQSNLVKYLFGYQILHLFQNTVVFSPVLFIRDI